MVTSFTLAEITKLARLSPHKEICGLVDSEGDIYPIINVANSPHDFVFSKTFYGKALKIIKEKGRTIKCVYHSHLTGDANPTCYDLQGIKACKLDYLIVAGYSHTYTRYK